MRQEKEFERNRCFMFFESYLESAEKYQTLFGTEVAFNYLIGLIKYALYQEESEDAMTNGLVSALKNTIDSGQEKRAKSFSGENFEQTKVVAEYYRDHTKASQRAIADATGVSKTKVQKTLAKIRESGMDINSYIQNVINPNLNPNDNNNPNTNTNNNSETTTETSRDSSSETASPIKENSSLIVPSEQPVKEKIRTYDEIPESEHYDIYMACKKNNKNYQKVAEDFSTTPDVVKRIDSKYLKPEDTFA